MDESDPMRVVILGGGTAGWMTAAALSKYLGNQVAVTLIESDTIGTIGVGEATIPQIRLFNSGLGIDEHEFLRETSGTFKLGIEFIGWRREGHRYFHSFGSVGRKVALVPFYQYWLRYRSEGGTLPLDAFNFNAQAAERGLYGVSTTATAAQLPVAAYHFDAGLYAAFLRRFAEKRGVKRHEGLVKETRQNSETGFIESLVLESGETVDGDLFVDCSGFKGILIQEALKSGYEDWSKWLPCDRAIAVPSTGNGRLDPFTRSTAREAGWQWQIPLQHRTGNGHVYSSAFMNADTANRVLMENLPGKPLDEPRQFKFRTGKRRHLWKKNCIALGLSSGFLEPLESTSIHLIQVGIAQLLAFFPDRNCDPTLANEFNKKFDFEFESIRDFLILHYHVTERDDSDFWKYCTGMTIPDSLSEKIDLFKSSGGIVRFNTELFDIPSWLQVMWGQGLRPKGYHPMANAVKAGDLERYITNISREVQDQLAKLADHGSYIKRISGT